MAGKRLVLFGAGMTGRGQVAQLAYEDGWELTLADRDAALIGLLRRSGSYTVQLLGERPREVRIGGYTALHTDEAQAIAAAVERADLVVTSVLAPNLPAVARLLAQALAARFRTGVDRALNVIAAENMNDGSTFLRGHVRQCMPGDCAAVFERTVGFPNSMVARVVPVARDPLVIPAEEYSEWTADRNAVVGEPPQLAGLEWVANQTARLQRKLYIHNTGHAVCGYLGWLAGYRYVHEAAQDSDIMARMSQAISESGSAVSREHGFAREETRAYEDNLKERLLLSALPDEIRRVIRHPIRKLGKEERLVGPLLLCERFALPAAGICYGVAAVLASSAPDGEQFQRMRETVQSVGPIEALSALVGYRPGERAARQIAQAYEEVLRRHELPGSTS